MTSSTASPRPEQRIVALGFSPDANALLQRLQGAGVVATIRWPGSEQPAATWLEDQWPTADAVLAVGACGLMVRLIGPLLHDKATDPAQPENPPSVATIRA